jgi:DNA invertase Pin-like site-specific DNA recombinase
LLSDPIDTPARQGRFSLWVIGAMAELKLALIREQTKAGDPEAIHELRLA